MTSINETEFEDDTDELEDHLFRTSREYYRVEENLKRIHFLLVDYLVEVGRRDLFKSLTLTDLSSMIYNPSYIRELIHNRPDCLL
jgi:hypothetical protein